MDNQETNISHDIADEKIPTILNSSQEKNYDISLNYINLEEDLKEDLKEDLDEDLREDLREDCNDKKLIIANYDTLVLSGCSQKGFITLGALQYCNDNFLLTDIKYLIGTSAGAIICYLLVIGYTPIEIMVYLCTNQILERMQHFNIVGMIQGNGASTFNHLQEHLEKMTIEKIGYLPTMLDLYEKTGKTLVCITHNVTKNITEYISHETNPSIPCLTALHMSANLPLIFDKYKYGNSFYVDGGLSDNFGIQMGDKLGNKVLGILLCGDLDNNNCHIDGEIDSIEYIYKLLLIPIDKATDYKISLASDKCDIIQLKSIPKKFFNFDMNSKEKMEMFCAGYNQIREII